MKGLAKIVKSILVSDRMARNSDYYLWVKVCEVKCPECLNKPFREVISNHNELELPNFESVGRARRKVQELNPELQCDEIVQDERTKRELEYRDFSREVHI